MKEETAAERIAKIAEERYSFIPSQVEGPVAVPSIYITPSDKPEHSPHDVRAVIDYCEELRQEIAQLRKQLTQEASK